MNNSTYIISATPQTLSKIKLMTTMGRLAVGWLGDCGMCV